MKIAVFVEYFPPKLGSDRRIYELMKRLSNKHEIHFIVLPPFRVLSGNLPLTKKDVECYIQDKEKTVIQNSITGHFVPVPCLTLKLWGFSYTVAYFLTLISLLPKVITYTKKVNPQLIVLNYPSVYTGILGFFIGKLLRKPILLDFNDLIAQYTINLLNFKKSGLKAKFLILFQNLITKNCNKIIATTNFIKKYSHALGVKDGKIVVIPNGADPKFFNPSKYDAHCLKLKLNLIDKKICLYCGRLDNWAGINIITELSLIFKQKGYRVSFLVAGAGTKENELPKNIVMMGEAPYEEMPKILFAADIILVPFPSNEVSHAASPLKLFEGMAMQKPIVASKVSGIEEVVTHNENGILVDPDDIHEWCEAISTLLSSKPFAKKLGENARQLVKEKYNWFFLAKKYENAFTKLCN